MLPLFMVMEVLALGPLSAQTIQGAVVDARTSRPVALASVILSGVDGDTIDLTLSRSDGLFALTGVVPSTYWLHVRAVGYHAKRVGPFELARPGPASLMLPLDPDPVGVEGIEVVVPPLAISDDALIRKGFYERMLDGRGQFLTPADIEANRARYTADLFIGLEHVSPQWSLAPWRRWLTLQNPFGRGRCLPRVYVDDMWVNKPGFERFGAGWSLDDAVRRESIKAAELYWASEAPWRYRAPDGLGGQELCGVLLIWTHHG